MPCRLTRHSLAGQRMLAQIPLFLQSFPQNREDHLWELYVEAIFSQPNSSFPAIPAQVLYYRKHIALADAAYLHLDDLVERSAAVAAVVHVMGGMPMLSIATAFDDSEQVDRDALRGRAQG